MKETLLVELLTEELPPRALSALSESFSGAVFTALKEQGFAGEDSICTPFATPRRLALSITHVLAGQPDRIVEKKGPAVASGIDADGQPTRALEGFMRSAGVTFAELSRTVEGKAEYFVARTEKKGESLDVHLAPIVAQALKKLPIPKVMRWGDSDHQFVRPVHSLMMVHGARVIPGEVLGLTSRRTTRGHRFMSNGEIAIDHAAFYENALEKDGKVIASFAARRKLIEQALAEKAASLQATINRADGLLDEVTALVEWPVVYVAEFEREFLEVPQECLILTMQQNQKYFPLIDAQGKLLNKFLIVSNMAVADPRHIIGGNQRVVRPRLSDARFFYTQDRKRTLESRLAGFGSVVYHNKLGSQAARIERLQTLAHFIARRINADPELAARAARLAKADLLSDMVGEFPELQGIMGRYYARADGEPDTVAEAIATHYQPRFAGDALPADDIACAVALADRLDALTGFFGIGQTPTGDKDPFGLRRAALAVIRILTEKALPLDLVELISAAAAGFPTGILGQVEAKVDATAFQATLFEFILERLRGYLREAGYSPSVIEAVLAKKPTQFDQVPAKLAAVRTFVALPEAEALAAANKRIGNILKKAEEETGSLGQEPAQALFREAAEKALFERVHTLMPQINAHVEAQNYSEALTVLAAVRPEVDRFFDEVMVMAEDPAVRTNRLRLLNALSQQLNAVADISRLAV